LRIEYVFGDEKNTQYSILNTKHQRMASQVAHVVYAKKYLDRHPAMNADLFLLGTLLPDVRRVTDEVKRKDTHIVYPELDLEFKNLSPFEAGYRFHLWCDMRREEILNKYNFYDLKYAADIGHLPAKLLEDELVYEKYNNWEKLIWLLENPPEVKINLNVSSASAKASADFDLKVSQETIERWYAVNAKYFEGKPNEKTLKAFLWKHRKLRKLSDEIIDVVEKLRNNSKVVEILLKISDEILEQ